MRKSPCLYYLDVASRMFLPEGGKKDVFRKKRKRMLNRRRRECTRDYSKRPRYEWVA